MKERTKLYVDMAKGFSLGFFGAVLFRDFGFWTNMAFTVAGAGSFAITWVLTGCADRTK